MVKEKESEKEKKTKTRDAMAEKEEKIAETEEQLKRKERIRRDHEIELEGWIPKTQLGRDVKAGKIKNIDEIIKKNLRILEAEIVNFLIPDIESDLINIGQSKGKFGGGKRRPWKQTQRKTSEGNVPTFSCLAVVGDKNAHIGIGRGKAKETVPAKQKAIKNAKINIISIKRGCGSFECICNEPHSIPSVVEGKCGSSKIKLIPAPKGTGLVIDDECKKILRLAGIKDVYSKTSGQTKTKLNLVKACINALKKLSQIV